jgi:hypothetical protein
LKKWDVVRVYRPDIIPPHDKFCICIDVEKNWFFYINSKLPPFRKAREVAVAVENFEANFLTHTSYVDVAQIIRDVPEGKLAEALADHSRMHGQLAPFLIERIKESVRIAASLSENEKDIILA